MSKYKMWPERLLDFYYYLVMYQRTYVDGEADRLIEIVKQKYYEDTGKDITKASNPRNAGPKIKYTKEQIEEIRRIYDDCGSVRETARRSGVSTTTVYKAINT